MKLKLKKAMSILIAFTLLFGSFAFGLSDGKFADFVLKAEAKALGDYEYTDATDQTFVEGIRIVSVNKSVSGNVVVPAYIERRPVLYISENAFSNCTAIESVTLPATLRYVESGAFSGCTSLESVTFSSNELAKIGYEAFKNCTSLKSIVIPNGVVIIGADVFYGCENLTSVTLPNTVNELYDSVFKGCKKLENITIPNSVTKMGNGVFEDCESLTNVILSDNLTNIGDSAFEGCKKLENITIPDTVTDIGSSAFQDCSELKEITIPDKVTNIDMFAFYACKKLESIIIPAGVTNIASTAFSGCYGLESITVNPENKVYSSDKRGVLFNKDKTELILYPAGNTSESYIVPDGVTSIDTYAFTKCDSLKTIILPDSITEITSSAIQSCANLECVHVPESVTNISKYFITYSNNYICSTTQNCYAKEFADANGFEFRICNGHNASVPESTTKPVVTEPATTKPVIVPEETTKPVEIPTTTKPAETTKPVEPTTKPSVGFIFRILEPSVSVIKYGETLILHTNLISISAGEKIEWSVEGEGVTIKPSADGLTCAVTSTATGDVTVTAKYTDANGVEHVSEQELESNASFWQKIVSFFKNLFGMNRVIEQRIKFGR